MATDTDCITRRGETDEGKTIAATIMQLAAIAVAGINTAAAIYLAGLQWDIAKRYYDISAWWRNYYKSTYAPWEDQELAEVSAIEKEPALYDISIGQHRTSVRGQFQSLAETVIKKTSPYCTGLRKAMIHDAVIAESSALAAASNLGYRDERARKDALDDLRWKKIEAVLNRGRNFLAGNVSYTQFAAGIYGNLTTQATQSASGALYYLGYSSQRNETQYPMTGYYTAEVSPITAALNRIELDQMRDQGGVL